MTPARSKAALLDEVRRRPQELYELCASLIRIPSENPPGDTTALVAFVLDYLRSRGFKPDVHEPRPGMPNVVATLGSGWPNLVLSDTSPISRRERLDGPPFGSRSRTADRGRARRH